MNIQDLTLDKLVEALFLIPMESDEVWKEINFIKQAKSRYYVSNKGKIISLCRRKARVLKPFLSGKGYYCVSIGGKNYKIHRLVAIAFMENTENKPIVHHKDNKKTNNDISNLIWATASENTLAYYEKNK